MNEIRGFDWNAGLVTVIGPDAQSFLQSLVSQDLDPLADGEGARSLLLQPQGKLVANFVLLRVAADEWWCITDEGVSEALAAGLNRFKIRVKADIEDRTAASAALLLLGAAPGIVTAVGDVHAVEIAWGRDRAVVVVGSSVAVDAARASLVDVGWGTEADFEAARIAAGVPRQGVDIDERTIPQEAFLDEDAVSFTKGCFVGQELVCRIDTRGHVNRFLRRVMLSDATAPAGAEIVIDDRVVGALTSVAGTDALAMVRREVEPPASVVVRWDDHEIAGTVASR